MKLRLLHDWVHVRVELARTQTTGGIVLVAPEPIRMAEVLAVGPGRRNKKGVLIPTQVKVGERFPFFKGASETRQGHALAMLLEDNEALLLESDVLFIADEPVEVTL